MKRAGLPGLLVTTVLVTTGLVATGLTATLVAAEEPSVQFLSPSPAVPIFDQIEVELAPSPSAEVARLELFVDEIKAGERQGPPYRFTVDVGGDNRRHYFRAVLTLRSGATVEGRLETPAFAVDEVVDATLQQLYVTVTRDGARVLDLVADDFAIVDQGERQELVTFARGDVPLTSILMVDSSASMEGDRLRSALRGVDAFLERLGPQDEASVLLFSDRLLYASPISNDPTALHAGLSEVRAGGGTALDDHLYLALKRLEPRQGRRVVVLLSDGVDSHSVLQMRDVQWLARRSQAIVYWVRTRPGDESHESRFSSWKDADAYRQEYRLLTTTVLESGGRIVDLERLQDAEKAFGELMSELREQYVLGYYPSAAHNDGTWHQVHVRLRPGGVQVRTRGGYIDY